MDIETKMSDQISYQKEIQCVEYQDPNAAVIPLLVRVGLTLYDMGLFDVAAATVRVVFEIMLVYNDNIFKSTFGSTQDSLPWNLPNALQLEVAENRSYTMRGIDLNSLNIFAKRQSFKKADKLQLFRIESYLCRATLKLTTFPSQDPFQSIYFCVKLAMLAIPGTEMTEFVQSKSDFHFPGVRNKMADFTKGEDKIRNVSVKTSFGTYSRLHFIFEYKKSPLEDIAKYYVLPFLINALTIAFYDTVDSLFESAGAYFLAIIALLFTLPDTGAFTRNEKSVVFGSIWMLAILFVLISWPALKAQIILGSVLSASYGMLLIYDIATSSKANAKYRDVLFNKDLTKLDIM